MIRFFTSHYREQSAARKHEIRICLDRNLAISVIDVVCLLLEGIETPCPTETRLKVRTIHNRPTYQDFFRWTNELNSSDNDISIIANSDIYFDESLLALAKSLRPNQCAALSRWDVQPDGTSMLFDRNDSQDAWIFKGKIRSVVADFCVGIPRCDNRILYELLRAGYEVINPAFSVKAFHLHAGERGEYPGEILGRHVAPPYAYLWAHNLMSLPETILYRLRNPAVPLGWRIDWRKLQRSLPWRVWKKLSRRFSVIRRQA